MVSPDWRKASCFSITEEPYQKSPFEDLVLLIYSLQPQIVDVSPPNKAPFGNR